MLAADIGLSTIFISCARCCIARTAALFSLFHRFPIILAAYGTPQPGSLHVSILPIGRFTHERYIAVSGYFESAQYYEAGRRHCDVVLLMASSARACLADSRAPSSDDESAHDEMFKHYWL